MMSGSCRDSAVPMIEVRSLGLAARFVSGYLHVRESGREENVGGGTTHAWLEVYGRGGGSSSIRPTASSPTMI
jgi:transglutaminase-like putative cysteine protease